MVAEKGPGAKGGNGLYCVSPGEIPKIGKITKDQKPISGTSSKLALF